MASTNPGLPTELNPTSGVAAASAALLREVIGARRENSTQAELLLQLLPVALYVCDAAGRITFFNRQLAGLIGREPALRGKRERYSPGPMTRLDGSPLPKHSHPVALALREGRPLREGTVRLGRADGETFIASVAVEPIFDSGGAIGGALVVLQDVTQQKHTEERLRARETELQLLRTSAPVVLSHWTLDHRLIFASRAFADRWNTSPEKLVGRSVAEILGETAFATVRPYIDRVTAGETVEFDLEVPYQEIGQRFVHIAYAPELGADGRVRGYLAVVTDMTDRLRAEDALRQSEERLRLATRAGKIGLWDWEVATNRLTWTESLYQIHGVDRATFNSTAQGFAALLHPDDRAPVQRALQSALDHGAPYELEYRAVRPGGAIVWLFSNATVVREGGVPARVVGATLDITARKSAELALRESEARFRALASHAPVGIYLTDTNGDCVFVNEVWRTMSGLTPDEARGKGWARAIHPEDRERAVGEWYAAVRARKPFASEYRFQRPDGAVFWLQGSAVESRNASGATTGHIGILVDLTQRRGAEEALRESEKRFRTLASHAPVGIFLTNPQGETIFVNDVWSRIVGLDSPRALGHGWAEGIHPEDRPRVLAEWEAALRSGASSKVEYRFLHQNGAVTWVQGNAVQLRDEAGRPAGYIGTIADVTERKLAEEKLRAREAQLRLISTNAPIMLLHCDRAERLLFVNRAYAARFQLEPEQVIGRTTRELLGAEAHAALAPFVRRVLAGEAVSFELEIPYRTIGRRFMRIAYAPDLNADGTVRGWLAALSDMTEQKRTDDALRRLAAIVESSGDAIFSKDLDGIITSWNMGAERIFGYAAHEVVGQSVRLLVPPERGDEETRILERIRQGERIQLFDTVRRRKDDARIDISLTVSPLEDAEGNVVGASTIARDVSERNRDAAELRRRTTSLEALHRVGTALAAELDSDAIAQSVTDAVREVSGAAFGAFFQKNPASGGGGFALRFISPAGGGADSPARFAAAVVALHPPHAVGRVADASADPVLAAGCPAVRSYLAVPVMLRSGEVVGRLVVGHAEPHRLAEDVERTMIGIAAQAAIAIDNAKLYEALSRELTEKSRAEAGLRVAQEQLQAHAADLEQKVDERTASLREAIVQMEEFSYSVSHDLRAPLRAMNGYAQALLEDYGGRLDPTARHYLDRIQRGSQRMEKLTHDLLTYSRVVRSDVNLSEVDLERVVRDLASQYAELQPPAADVEVVQPLQWVRAHESSLGQCLANLLTNAAKFVAPGVRPHIRVRTEPAGDRVRVWIEDNGIGIAPQFQAALFRVFERAPTPRPYEGTGIGLAIVRKAVEKMDGRCGVESDGVRGSRFWVELPRA